MVLPSGVTVSLLEYLREERMMRTPLLEFSTCWGFCVVLVKGHFSNYCRVFANASAS